MKKAIIITICGAAIIWTIADFVLALPVKADEEAEKEIDPLDYWSKINAEALRKEKTDEK